MTQPGQILGDGELWQGQEFSGARAVEACVGKKCSYYVRNAILDFAKLWNRGRRRNRRERT